MRNELWVMCVGSLMAISLVSTLSILVITNQRAELLSLHRQVAQLNSTLTDTNGRLTFLAQKANPLIGAECHIDRVFVNPTDIPPNYKGHVFVETAYPSFDNYGIGVICR